MKNVDPALQAVLFETLRVDYDFDYKKSILSQTNYQALKDMFDDLSKLKNDKEKQSKVVAKLLRNPIFKGKRKQKLLLKRLSSGRKVSFKDLKVVLHSKGKILEQFDQQWRNSLSQLKIDLMASLSKFREYFTAEIKSSSDRSGSYYELTIKDTKKYPHVIVK